MKTDEPTNGSGDGKAFKTIQSILLAGMLGGMGYLAKTTIDNTNEIVKMEVKMDERNSRATANEAVQSELIRSISVLHDSVNSLDFRVRAVEKGTH